MDKDALTARRDLASKRFDELQDKKKQLTKQLEELEVECIKLQGEYRAYNALIDEPKEGEIVKDATPTE